MIQIDGYDNFEIVGRGGFAVVYKARQVSVGRDVAIKVLSDPTPDDDLVRRFERESKAVGALSWHPHIAAVVDAGTTSAGQAYIVFELMVGGSLEDRIATGPIPWQAAVRTMIQVADAVEAAHRSDVLHRDIKPANILVNRLGDAKLADFGIASMQDGTKTETGMLATTVAHAAPELFDGAPSSTSTDVYALGSTLHNLVSGTPPFAPLTGERVLTTIARIAHEPPPPLDPSLVPPQVAAVIAHALAKQPAHRLRSAAAFGKGLQQAQQELQLAVTPMPVADDPTVPVPIEAPLAPGPISTQVDTSKAAKPLSRTIGVLVAVAGLLAAAVGGVLLFGLLGDDDPVAITNGGVRIRSAQALTGTEIPSLPGANAIDQNDQTFWGIGPNAADGLNIVGTTFVLGLVGDQTITSVGISNGTSVGISNGSESALGRVASVRWATSIAELANDAPSVITQDIPDQPGNHVDDVRIRTDQIVLQIFGVHDVEAENAGIAEILLVAE